MFYHILRRTVLLLSHDLRCLLMFGSFYDVLQCFAGFEVCLRCLRCFMVYLMYVAMCCSVQYCVAVKPSLCSFLM